MARVSIRYFVARAKKNGAERYYWQPDAVLRAAGWKMRRLSDIRPDAMAQAEDINRTVDQWRAGLTDLPMNEKPGTVDAVIAAYKQSREFKACADKTRKDYAYHLNLVSEWAGTESAIMINARMVQDLYETLRVKKPRKAAYMVQVIRLLFSFAERQSLIPKNSNPATRPAIDYRAGKGTIWAAADIAHFVTTADEMGYETLGTAVMLNEWLGQRRGDIIRFDMAGYRDGGLHITQGKTGAEVILPVDLVPSLKARIEMQIAANGNRRKPCTRLIQQTNGQPYTADGFMSAFERIRERASETRPGMKTLIFKDLRHTAVTRLAEAGCTIPMIAAITGHSFKTCQDIVDRYNVRTTEMAREAFARRLAAETLKDTKNSGGMVSPGKSEEKEDNND